MRALLWAVWLAAAAVTVAHALRPHGLVVQSGSSAAVVETAVACGATLLAALFFGRWRQRDLALDLGTCFAFAVLAAGKLWFTVLPLAMGGPVDDEVRAAALLCGLVTAVLLGLAALLPGELRVSRTGRLQSLLFVLAVVAMLGAVRLAAPSMVNDFGTFSGVPSTESVGDNGLTAITMVQLISALGFAIASMRFARRDRQVNDTFYGWLAVTAALWALARINYAWTPARLAEELTVGDWLRLAGYGVGVLAASYEFTGYWRRLADVAVLEERRRLARDLHDGLAQELAFISTQARSLSQKVQEPGIEMLARAADRALDESRRGIAALTRPIDEPLDVALAQQAEELSGRLGVRVLLDLEPVGSLPGTTREALLRIAREAITNSGRHGRPSKITVHLSNHDGVTLRVSDDGRGFRVDDKAVYAGGRYGVAGMRERAAALGGSLMLESRLYVGTKVEVHVP